MHSGPSPEWLRFQELIKNAIRRGWREHDRVGIFLDELRHCEVVLRGPEDDISSLPGPVARELAAAMERYEEAGRPGGYDEVCAANVVLASLNGLAQAAGEAD
ncbi:MAG: hypothetical protein ABEI27_13795 [Halobellus sp.]|uniref:hypothetical protein n=1 Tax=Halobellus sp. TaxID=1979212 RepID=UPI0035D4BBA4